MKQDINKKEEEEACQKILGRYHKILTLCRLQEGLFVSTKPILMKEGTKEEEEEAYRKVLSPCRYYGLCCEVLIMCVCQWWFCSSLKHHKKQ